ncbi:MPP2-like protein, partial [Mya arenaria]
VTSGECCKPRQRSQIFQDKYHSVGILADLTGCQPLVKMNQDLTLQNNLDRLQDATGASDNEIDFLSNLLSDPTFQAIVDAQDRLEEYREDQPEGPEDEKHAAKCIGDVYHAIGGSIDTDPNVHELNQILGDAHVKALLDAHDDIIDRNFEEMVEEQHRPQLFQSVSSNFQDLEDNIRLVGIMKSDEPLVNGMPVYTPQMLMDIIRTSEQRVNLKIIPAYQEHHHTSQMFMKAHFTYNPMNDRLIPSKEAGLSFQDGDILLIFNHDDPNWWQAQIVGDEMNRVGLIPSKNLEENRKAFVRSDQDYSKSSLLCGLKRKKKKKIKYSATKNKDRETMDMEIKADLYLEFGEFNGNLYGTKLETVHDTIRSGRMCVLDVNPTEEDFLKIIDESAQIEKVYKSYFDTTIVNDSFEETFREIRKIVDTLSTDTQWVPVNWVY